MSGPAMGAGFGPCAMVSSGLQMQLPRQLQQRINDVWITPGEQHGEHVCPARAQRPDPRPARSRSPTARSDPDPSASSWRSSRDRTRHRRRSDQGVDLAHLADRAVPAERPADRVRRPGPSQMTRSVRRQLASSPAPYLLGPRPGEHRLTNGAAARGVAEAGPDRCVHDGHRRMPTWDTDTQMHDAAVGLRRAAAEPRAPAPLSPPAPRSCCSRGDRELEPSTSRRSTQPRRDLLDDHRIAHRRAPSQADLTWSWTREDRLDRDTEQYSHEAERTPRLVPRTILRRGQPDIVLRGAVSLTRHHAGPQGPRHEPHGHAGRAWRHPRAARPGPAGPGRTRRRDTPARGGEWWL